MVAVASYIRHIQLLYVDAGSFTALSLAPNAMITVPVDGMMADLG